VKGPLRDRSLGTKLTEVEYARVEAAALRAGVGLSEWCRRAALDAADRDGSQTPDGVLLAELLALRAVLLNVMFRMTNGDALSKEEMRQLIERADRDKHKRAAAVLKTGENDAG
jgi:mobilization protein NikA